MNFFRQLNVHFGIMLVDFGDYPVDELSPHPSFDQPSQHHKTV
jgi:hypothetical protein